MKTKYQVAICGLNSVGATVAHQIRTHPSMRRLKLRAIGLRDVSKPRHYYDEHSQQLPFRVPSDVNVVTDLNRLASDASIDIIIDATNVTDPSFVSKALESGKHVVSANKRMIANHGNVLFQMASEKRRALLIEACVGGQIPILRVIGDYARFQCINSLSGIVNGTCGFILSRIAAGLSYEQALSEAMKVGIAEDPPELDVMGWDSSFKAVILGSLAFQTPMMKADSIGKIFRQGIKGLAPLTTSFAKHTGSSVRMVATISRNCNGVSIRVLPSIIPAGTHLSSTEGTTNCIRLATTVGDPLTMIGTGAGGNATAAAIVSDLGLLLEHNMAIDVAKLYGAFWLGEPAHIIDDGQTSLRLAIQSCSPSAGPGILAAKLNTISAHGLSVTQLVNHDVSHGDSVDLIVLAPANVRQVLNAVADLDARNGATQILLLEVQSEVPINLN